LTDNSTTPSIHFWLPLVVWIVAILAVSSIPGPTLAKVGFSVQDKLAHASEYAILGFLACRWLLGVRLPASRATSLSLVMGAGLGAADESWQRIIPGRITSIADWTADLVGVAAGVAAASIYYLLLQRHASRRALGKPRRGENPQPEHVGPTQPGEGR
jgi:VanZ family protein